MSFAQNTLLAQSRPSGTSAVSAFTATLRTEINLIIIANNTASPANASLFHDDDGSTFDQSTALLYAKAVGANDYEIINLDHGSGIALSVDGQIGIQTGTGNALTFSLYGTTESRAFTGVS